MLGQWIVSFGKRHTAFSISYCYTCASYRDKLGSFLRSRMIGENNKNAIAQPSNSTPKFKVKDSSLTVKSTACSHYTL